MVGKNRSYLMGIVGGYLIYIAYELFSNRNDQNTTMTPAARIAFIVFFVLVGIALLVFAFRLWFTANKAEKEKKDEDPPENENSLK